MDKISDRQLLRLLYCYIDAHLDPGINYLDMNIVLSVLSQLNYSELALGAIVYGCSGVNSVKKYLLESGNFSNCYNETKALIDMIKGREDDLWMAYEKEMESLPII